MLSTSDQESVAENARIALEYLDDQVFGLEEQERQVENIVYDFLQSREGKCALLEGKRNCGRESTLRKVLNKYNEHLRVINAGFVVADPSYQPTLAKENENGHSIFLVRDAEKLLTPQQQKFLYTMVDKATHCSWLVFFSVSKQDFSQKLQKQVTSRTPKIQVSFEVTHDYDEYCSVMKSYLIPSGSKCEESDSYKAFVEKLDFKSSLRPVFETSAYCTLKQIAAQILMLLGYYKNSENLWSDIEFTQQIRSILDPVSPSFNGRILLLKDQTLRAQCVFLCVWRLLRDKEPDGKLFVPITSYRNVFIEFKMLANQYYPVLDVSSDIYVFRELDHLVKMGLLKADVSSNVTNTSFRKVWLHINDKIVKDIIPKLNLPGRVSDFLTAGLK